MSGSSLSAKLEASRAAAAKLQSAVDEHAREIAAAEKALATARRAQAKHAARLKAVEGRCVAAAAEVDKAVEVAEAEAHRSTSARPSLQAAAPDLARERLLDALAAGPGRPSTLPDRLAGGVVTLVVGGEALIVHARVLADSPYFAARLARWDEAAEPLRLEVPTASVKDVVALLERLYAGPRADAWRVRDVAGGFRMAAVCALLMLDDLLVEIANGIRRVATTDDIKQMREALAGQDWPPLFAQSLSDIAVQHGSMPEPDAVAEMVMNAAVSKHADRPAVGKLLAAWRGGLCKDAVADGLLVAVSTWSDLPPVDTLRWVLDIVADYLTADQATDIFAAFAGNPVFDVERYKGTWRLGVYSSAQQHVGGSFYLVVRFASNAPAYTGIAEACAHKNYIVTHLDAAWTQCGEGASRTANSRVVELDEGISSLRKEFTRYHGHCQLRQAYLAHLTRCADDGADLARALQIGLQTCPPRFPDENHACKRRRIQHRDSGYRRQRGHNTDHVHGFYLGPLPCPEMQYHLRDDEKLFVWGPEQLRMLAKSPLRAALVKELLGCPCLTIAHTLDQAFLQELEADEQKALVESLNKAPNVFQAWARPDRLGLLSLPARMHAGKLLLPAVATLNEKVREIVLGLALR